MQGLSLEQSVSQFSNTMTAQADLRVEAAHLRRFLHNFRNDPSTTAPRPIVRPTRPTRPVPILCYFISEPINSLQVSMAAHSISRDGLLKSDSYSQTPLPAPWLKWL